MQVASLNVFFHLPHGEGIRTPGLGTDPLFNLQLVKVGSVSVLGDYWLGWSSI